MHIVFQWSLPGEGTSDTKEVLTHVEASLRDALFDRCRSDFDSASLRDTAT
jgi:hypothetical protein